MMPAKLESQEFLTQRETKINCLSLWPYHMPPPNGSEVLDNQYKIRSDASQPIVVRWSKDSDFVG